MCKVQLLIGVSVRVCACPCAVPPSFFRVFASKHPPFKPEKRAGGRIVFSVAEGGVTQTLHSCCAP